MSAHQIRTAIREALAHERTAGKAEDAYALKMKAAGASMFAAFQLAAATAPPLQGRKLDEAAMRRLYVSTQPRPWWDHHLKEARCVTAKGVADRENAKRLIQWHLDPGAAQARHMTRRVQQLAAQKRLAGQKVADARGMNKAPKPPSAYHEAALDAHAEHITQAASVAMAAGRELGTLEDNAAPAVTLNDLLGEVSRIGSAVRRVKAEAHAAALETLRVTARELEELA